MGLSVPAANSTPVIDVLVEKEVEQNLESIKNETQNEEEVTEPVVWEEEAKEVETLVDDRGAEESKKDDNTEDDDLYNIKNFVI